LRNPCFPQEKTNNPYPLLIGDKRAYATAGNISGVTLFSAAQANKWGDNTYGHSGQNRTIASASSKSPWSRTGAQSQRHD
jgi:hypothetical protein